MNIRDDRFNDNYIYIDNGKPIRGESETWVQARTV